MKPMRRVVLGLGLALLAACGSDQPVGPVAGELTLTLVTPAATDGAVLLRVTGPVESVVGVGDYVVAAAAAPGGLWRIVVAGNVTNGPLARIRVPDITSTGQYLAIVEQVAVRGTFALVSTAGYSVQIAK